MNCKNCHKALNDNDAFCNNCGAKIIRNRLTIKSLFAHFSEQFLNYDNKFLQTFITLFKRPEEVVDSYINGTRKKYVNVISYFAIAITLTGFQMYFINKFFPDQMDLTSFVPIEQREFQEQNNAFVQEYMSLISMLLVPLYALMSKLVFFDRKEYNYTEHLVLNMYISAHVAIFSVIFIMIIMSLGVNFMTVGMLSLPIQIIFYAYALKRIYKLSLGQTLLKITLFLLILIICFIGIMVMGVAISFFTGDMQKIIEAKKTSKDLGYLGF